MNDIKILYMLPMLTQALIESPRIQVSGTEIQIAIKGRDLQDNIHHVELIFEGMQCYRHTSECFTKSLMNAYDSVVEIVDSEWLRELNHLNPHAYSYWSPRHFAVYIDSNGMYEIVARDFRYRIIPTGT